MDQKDTLKFAKGLASAAVDALVATHPISAVALGAIVPPLLGRLESDLAGKALREQIALGVTAWATSEHLNADLLAGMERAATTIQRWGLQDFELKELGYDGERATNKIIARARQVDDGWAGVETQYEEPDFVVARNAIRATMDALIASRHRVEATVMQATKKQTGELQSGQHRLGDRIEGVGVDVTRVAQGVDRVARALISGADVADVTAYLLQRVKDWDATPWLGTQPPSQIERRLSVSTRGKESRTLASADAASLFDHLVLLGGPGSGKSWLAQRLARDAALLALKRLQSGAALSEIQIPLLTTWDQWTKVEEGGTRRTLIASSMHPALGLSDLGGQEETDRLIRTIESNPNVLAIIDALDESTNKSNIPRRITSLEKLKGWRTIVTSRYSVWEGLPIPSEMTQVADVLPLEWREDIVPFIRKWFTATPERAIGLLQRIEDDQALRSSASVPLLLTFYCMFADHSPPETPLPVLRRTLYEEIIDQLLAGEWAGQAPTEELDDAKRLLRVWAWESVQHSVDSAGLGAWGETFKPSSAPMATIRRSVEHVAPLHWQSRGHPVRRFRHRSLQEHLVAEHIGDQLGTEEAADVVFPHIWFDPDWQVAAPAAIAAHRERDQLLDLLLKRATPIYPIAENQEVRDRLHVFLLRVCSESNPEDWDVRHQAHFRRLRIDAAARHVELVARTAHWGDTTGEVSSAILAHLKGPDSHGDARLFTALVQLAVSPEDRARTRAALMDARTLPRNSAPLARAVAELSITPEQRATPRAKLLASLALAYEPDLKGLIDGLLEFNPTPEECKVARRILLQRIDAHQYPGGSLVVNLLRLGPTPEECKVARISLLRHLDTADPHDIRLDTLVDSLVDNLLELEVTPGECAIARISLMALLRRLNTTGWFREKLVDKLTLLNPTVDERREIRKYLIAQIPDLRYDLGIRLYDLGTLVDKLMALGPEPEELVTTCQSLLAQIRILLPAEARIVIGGLKQLVPAAGQSDITRLALIEQLPRADPRLVPELVRLFVSIAPTPSDRATACTVLLARVQLADPWTAGAMVDHLDELDPKPHEYAAARAALVSLLGRADAEDVASLVDRIATMTPSPQEVITVRAALVAGISTAQEAVLADHLSSHILALDPTNEERVAIRHSLLTLFQTCEPRKENLALLAERLTAFDPALDERAIIHARILSHEAFAESSYAAKLTSIERAATRRELVAQLFEEEHWDKSDLARALLALEPTDDERAAGRKALLERLSHCDFESALEIVDRLLILEPTPCDRAAARQTLINYLRESDPWDADELADKLVALCPNQEDRTQTMAALLPHLLNSYLFRTGNAIEILSALAPTADERALMRDAALRNLARVQPPQRQPMVRQLRYLSTPEQWESWLHERDPS